MSPEIKFKRLGYSGAPETGQPLRGRRPLLKGPLSQPAQNSGRLLEASFCGLTPKKRIRKADGLRGWRCKCPGS